MYKFLLLCKQGASFFSGRLENNFFLPFFDRPFKIEVDTFKAHVPCIYFSLQPKVRRIEHSMYLTKESSQFSNYNKFSCKMV